MSSSRVALPTGMAVLERGWLSSNNVVLLGSASVSVVDTGYWSHAAQTIELIARASGGRPLATIVNTHLHSDHCGGNAALQAANPGVVTLIPPGLASAVAAWDPVALTYEPTGQICPKFLFDGVLRPGTSTRLGDLDWEIHAAPGHDPHSVVLFQRASRVLISADALWENGFGIVFPELEGDQAFGDVRATLDVIERLAPAVIIPGHGRAFADSAGALGRARSRLAAYEADPRRHATHAAKVLLKFKLLEWQGADRSAFVNWAVNTPYLRMIHQRFAPDEGLPDWVEFLIAYLAKSGALRVSEGMLLNA